MPAEGIEAEVIDPRTLSPLDDETILSSVAKTHRLVIVDEDNPRCSAATDIAAIGPSLLGFWPGISNFLFQPNSSPNLQFLSQLGLILFMFIVGLELDVQLLKNKADTAVVVSHASIIFPFVGGVSLAYSTGKVCPASYILLSVWPVHGHRHEHYGFSGAGANTARARA